MSNASINELIAQRAALDKKIADAQREQRGDAIQKVRALMSEYGLTLADVGAKGSAKGSASAGAPKKSTGKVAAKYRNKTTGESWSGRGLKPKWLAAALASGRSISDFAV
jgi:DNA-binding protein H-NS